MAQLRIERGGHKVAFLSKFHVEVDGDEVAKLKHGESATIDVPAGPHSLRIHTSGLTDGVREVDVPEQGVELVAGARQGFGAAVKSNLDAGGMGKKMAIEIWSTDDSE